MMLYAADGHGEGSLGPAHQLVDALGRFCESVEEVAAAESDVEYAHLQLLSLTHLVQESMEDLGELLTEIEASRPSQPPTMGPHGVPEPSTDRDLRVLEQVSRRRPSSGASRAAG